MRFYREHLARESFLILIILALSLPGAVALAGDPLPAQAGPGRTDSSGAPGKISAPDARKASLQARLDSASPPSRGELEDALLDPDPGLRIIVAKALGRLGDPLAIPAFIQAIMAEDPSQRLRQAQWIPIYDKPLSWRWGAAQSPFRSMVSGLAGLDGVPVDFMERLLTDPDPFARLKAAIYLGKNGRPASVPVLIPLLKDTDPRVREVAAEALGRRGSRDAFAPLVDLLPDGDPHVLRAVLISLGKLGDPRAVAPILKRLEADIAVPGSSLVYRSAREPLLLFNQAFRDPEMSARLRALSNRTLTDEWMTFPFAELTGMVDAVLASVKEGEGANGAGNLTSRAGTGPLRALPGWPRGEVPMQGEKKPPAAFGLRWEAPSIPGPGKVDHYHLYLDGALVVDDLVDTTVYLEDLVGGREYVAEVAAVTVDGVAGRRSEWRLNSDTR